MSSLSCIEQAHWRLYRFRSAFRHHKKSIIAVQCRWRQKIAKRELRRLKQVCGIAYSVIPFCVNFMLNMFNAICSMQTLQGPRKNIRREENPCLFDGNFDLNTLALYLDCIFKGKEMKGF